jgi:hypothetical protein
MVYILAIALVDATILSHIAPRGITLGAVLYLFGRALVLAIFFLVVPSHYLPLM